MKNIEVGNTTLEPLGRKNTAIEGEPEDGCFVLVEDDQVEVGVWECSPGSFRSEWPDIFETFTITAGRGVLIDQDGVEHKLEPGVMQVISPGSYGVWVIEETLRKSYTIVNQ